MPTDKEKAEKKILKEHARLSKLYKKKPLVFEIERKKVIKELIDNAPEDQQPKLIKLQNKWDKAMKGAGSKYNRLMVAKHLLMEQFSKLNTILVPFRRQ